MSNRLANLVKQLSTTIGTGAMTLTAATGGFILFNTAFGNGATTDTFFYFIVHTTASEYEWGTGHLSSSSVLVRDTILGSSNGGSAVNFSTGIKNVFNDVPANYQGFLDGFSNIVGYSLGGGL